jgi:hypothetical protein
MSKLLINCLYLTTIINFVNISVITLPIPVWIVLLSGSSITLLCSGYANFSTTSWIYSAAQNASNLTIIDKNNSSSQYISSSDFSLTISNISRNNEGYYACLNQISNTAFLSTYLFVEGYSIYG